MMKNPIGVMRLTAGRIVLLVLVAALPMSLALAAKPQGEKSDSAKAESRNQDDETGSSAPSPQIAASHNTDSNVGRTARPNDEQAKVIAEIKRLGGKVILDENKPDRPVISIDFEAAPMGEKMTDALLASLEGLTQLRKLNLRHPGNTDYTDSGLKHLESLTKLQSLSLGGRTITDAGVEHLKGLSQLRSLKLTGCRITDAGLVYFKGLSQLRIIGPRRELWSFGCGTDTPQKPTGASPPRPVGNSRYRI